jgi:hypothetical protein
MVGVPCHPVRYPPLSPRHFVIFGGVNTIDEISGKIFWKNWIFIDMKKVIKLTESDLIRLIKRVVNEQNLITSAPQSKNISWTESPWNQIPGKVVNNVKMIKTDTGEYLGLRTDGYVTKNGNLDKTRAWGSNAEGGVVIVGIDIVQNPDTRRSFEAGGIKFPMAM